MSEFFFIRQKMSKTTAFKFKFMFNAKLIKKYYKISLKAIELSIALKHGSTDPKYFFEVRPI